MLHLPAAALKRPAPGVVLFHGFTGNRMESHWMFVKCSRALAQAGVASLRFDFYGSGESDGEFREMSLRGEIADGRAAVAFLRGQTGIDPERVGLLGLSLGGAVAAALAPSVQAKAVVLWSAVAHTARLRELVKQSAKKIPGKPGAMEFDAREIYSAPGRGRAEGRTHSPSRALQRPNADRPSGKGRSYPCFPCPRLLPGCRRRRQGACHHRGSGPRLYLHPLGTGSDRPHRTVVWAPPITSPTDEFASRVRKSIVCN